MTKTALSGMRRITLILGILLTQAFFPAPAAALTLILPHHAAEDTGLHPHGGTVTAPKSPASDLVVLLSSSDASRVSVPERVLIKAGETSAAFDITIVDNGDTEGSKTVNITASTEDGFSVKQALTVEDNDPGRVQFSAGSYSVEENARSAVITVVRTSSSSGEMGVDYGTVNGSASAGEDYESVSGTLIFHNGEVSKTFSVTILDDPVAEEEKTVKLSLSNPTAGGGLGTPNTAILTIDDNDRPDFFTEIFDQGDMDIQNQTLTFMPDGSRSFYAVCKTPAHSFPTDPEGGTTLVLSDDSYASVRLAGGAQVPFFGVRYGILFIGSNGYVTFSLGDSSYQESMSLHFNQPRISALFEDLNPSHGGAVSWRQLTDRVVVTFQDVPKNYSGNPNSFQIEMFFDGVLRLTHLGVSLREGLCGLSRGGGVPSEFGESDLTEYPDCFFLSLPESVTEGKDTDRIAPGTIGALIPPPAGLEIGMASSDPKELGVDKTIVFPAGESSVLFDLILLDDDLLDGTQTVTITATYPGGGSVHGVVRVNDNESATLTVDLPETAREGDGRLPLKGIVKVSAPVDKDVAVSVTSDEVTQVRVPESVAVLKGTISAPFDLIVENDVVVDGPQIVTITASVPGWNSGSSTMGVQDDGEDARFAPAIAAADHHSVALKDDGSVWVWGDNGCDPSLEETARNRAAPVRVTPLRDVFAVAEGGNHTLALTGDGRVWAWGENRHGELGDPALQSSARPVPVSHLTEVVAIAAGFSHSLALKSNGTVWAWGDNSSGQLGHGRTESSSLPVQVPGLTEVTAIATGRSHNLALKKDGTLWAWGANVYGQLGDGSFHTRRAPVQVSGLPHVISVAAGHYHSLAIQNDKKVWAWGRDWEGQPGDRPSDHQATPVQVEGLSEAILVSAGMSHSLALKANGTVWAWGENDHGQLGNGTFQPSSTPVEVSDLVGVIGLWAGANHSLALRNDGTVWAWGDNRLGQLGDGTFGSQNLPVQTIGPSENEPLDLIALSVVVPPRVPEGDGLLVGKGAVVLKEALKTDLTVFLSSSNSSEVSVPPRMIIPAGQTSASFDLTVWEDKLLDGPQAVRVTAFAPGYVPAGATMEVDDDESAVLSIAVPGFVTESDGWLPFRGKVSLSAPADKDITVYLSTQDATEVMVPATVVIMAGQTSAPFSILALDDRETDGTQEGVLIAAVPGWVPEARRIDVEDNEALDLFLGVEEENNENGSSLKTKGSLSILAPLPFDLVVDLFSDDPSKVVVPPFVILPAGETMAWFHYSVAGNRERGLRTTTLIASAPGWSPGVTRIRLHTSGTKTKGF